MKDKNKVIKRIVNALNANDYDSARKIIENDLKRLGCSDEYYFYLALITENLEKKRELYTKAIEVLLIMNCRIMKTLWQIMTGQ